MIRVAILDDYQNAALEAANWNSLSDCEVSVFDNHIADPEKLFETLMPFDVIVAMRERTPFPKSLLDRLVNLKLLVTTGMRNLAIDMEAARDAGVVVCGTEMLGYPAYEHAWALILALTKQIAREDQVMKTGGWQQGYGVGLNGKTLGVIGLGKLGAQLVRVGLAFNMNVVAWSENLTDERAAEVGVQRVSKEELLRTADIISIHMVLSDRTRDLIGAAELAMMKPSAYLVNTSRGPIINEAAMINALKSDAIAGAGLDVFDVEPLPKDHDLRQLPNVVLTGHTGFVVRELHQLVYSQSVENIQAWMSGTPLRVLNES
jgi:phosphoglycerate dehydrogenase-like enzyme